MAEDKAASSGDAADDQKANDRATITLLLKRFERRNYPRAENIRKLL